MLGLDEFLCVRVLVEKSLNYLSTNDMFLYYLINIRRLDLHIEYIIRENLDYRSLFAKSEAACDMGAYVVAYLMLI